MPEKKRFLKSVKVNFISLVDKGANQKTIIFKSSDTSKNTYKKTVQIAKLDADQRLVYGIVYSPDEADTDGDFTTAEVIKEMAHDFMRSRNTTQVDKQHDYNADEGAVVESWLLEKGDPKFPSEKPGSWAVAIKVQNDETWNQVKSGEISGLSLAGLAVTEEVQKSDKSLSTILKSITESIIDQIKAAIESVDFQKNINKNNNNSNEGNEMTNEEITKLVKETVAEALKPIEDVQKSVNELKTSFDTKSGDIEKRLKVVEEATPGSTQDGDNDTVRKNEKNVSIWL